MKSPRSIAALVLLVGMLAAYFAFPVFGQGAFDRFIPDFVLGLDLAGGAHLTYRIDTSTVAPEDVSDAVESLRDAIERRVNFMGVSEPLVQVASGGDEQRLIVELAGIKDINQAIQQIGATPYLEFRVPMTIAGEGTSTPQEVFVPSALTGRYLKRARIEYQQQTQTPLVGLVLNDEGAKIFEELTTQYVGKRIAIYLDGAPVSIPTVNEPITGGQAVITGNFTIEEANALVRSLNAGALPLNVELIGQQTVQSTLGERALKDTFRAGIIGVLAVMLFMLAYYRLPGLVAVLALCIYISLSLVIFKLLPVTLTAAAITGFILSVGMAVDANVLIFERTKEELRLGKTIKGSVEEGFNRAWSSIRDSNISSIMTSVILYYFGTSFVKGFALTLGIGVLVSMFSAIVVTRMFLRAVQLTETDRMRVLMGDKSKK